MSNNEPCDCTDISLTSFEATGICIELSILGCDYKIFAIEKVMVYEHKACIKRVLLYFAESSVFHEKYANPK
jgi:hypothetical protein